LAEIDIDKNHKVSFLEYCLWKYKKTLANFFEEQEGDMRALLEALEVAIKLYASNAACRPEACGTIPSVACCTYTRTHSVIPPPHTHTVPLQGNSTELHLRTTNHCHHPFCRFMAHNIANSSTANMRSHPCTPTLMHERASHSYQETLAEKKAREEKMAKLEADANAGGVKGMRAKAELEAMKSEDELERNRKEITAGAKTRKAKKDLENGDPVRVMGTTAVCGRCWHSVGQAATASLPYFRFYRRFDYLRTPLTPPPFLFPSSSSPFLLPPFLHFFFHGHRQFAEEQKRVAAEKKKKEAEEEAKRQESKAKLKAKAALWN